MLFWLGIVTLAGFLLVLLDIAWHGRAVLDLDQAPPLDETGLDGQPWPLVSVIIPARNEEKNIEEALRSVLALDYPRIEFIILNDRSTDRTGAMLAAIAARDARLRVIDIQELPPGWLGKNWALALGASRAAAQAPHDLLLFTDADIMFEPSVLRRAVGRLRAIGADHLTIAPRFLRAPAQLRAFLGAFAIFFALYARPWRAHLRDKYSFVGIGAFNLLTRAAYERIGTHRAIAMRPDDDMKLGKLVKRHGLRQEFMRGGELLKVEWYGSLRELIQGLMKNSFAGVDYSLARLLLSSLAMLVTMFWPWVALFVAGGAVWWINLAVVCAIAALYLLFAVGSGIERRFVLVFPLALLLMLYILWRATWLTYRHGGIHWRDTHYPLELLRANKV